MKKYIYISFIFCFLSSFIFAQQQSLLWEIKGKGLTKPSYVFGTIHVICPYDFIVSDSTKKAFSSVEQIFMELDMDDPNTLATMQQQMVLADGKTAKDYLSEEDYANLEFFIKVRFGLDMKVFGQLKPAALMSMMYIQLLRCQPKSYESELAKMANEAKKEVFGLETVADEMKIFDQIPTKKLFKDVVNTIKDVDKSTSQLQKMIDLYLSGDVNKLLTEMNAMDWGSFKGYEDVLLYNRNQGWLKQMETIMPKKSTFFAVGAGHLGGDKGVLALLKKAGYQVRPIVGR